ncbi:MAG: energy transducer TonB, partial [Schleiferiaceae bacterium]
RRALERPKPIYDCEGDGVVVVRIWVNRNGSVQRVEGGIKGSTTSQSCLISRAEEAARKTKWEGDPSATDLQIGTITYRFSRQ